MQQLQANAEALLAAAAAQEYAYCVCSLVLFAVAWPTAMQALAVTIDTSADAANDPELLAASAPPKLPLPPVNGPNAVPAVRPTTSVSGSNASSTTGNSTTTGLNAAVSVAPPSQSHFSALGTSRHVPRQSTPNRPHT